MKEKPPRPPPEALAQIRDAFLTNDIDTVRRILGEHDPRAWKRAQWHDATEERYGLLRAAWEAFAADLGRARRMSRERTEVGTWQIRALNDHQCRVVVAVVSCPALSHANDRAVLHVDVRAPGLVGERVRALQERAAEQAKIAKAEQRAIGRVMSTRPPSTRAPRAPACRPSSGSEPGS